jgi:hypothetical protein
LGDEVNRRAFLLGSGRALAAGTLASACDPSPSFATAQGSTFNGIEQRLAAALEAYDAQGNHRTATEVDNTSAEWLAREIR